MRKLFAGLVILLLGLGLGLYGGLQGAGLFPGFASGFFSSGPDVTSVANASLQAVRAQSRLTAFVARFTVAVTSRQSRFGLSARKTMIVPGLVRYELDLARLAPEAVRWNEAARTLVVDIPDVEISAPQIETTGVQEYREGQLLLALTKAEDALDAANRAHVAKVLIDEARAPMLMRMAREATRDSVKRMFLLPLRAAGIDADVRVRFPQEAAQAI